MGDLNHCFLKDVTRYVHLGRCPKYITGLKRELNDDNHDQTGNAESYLLVYSAFTETEGNWLHRYPKKLPFSFGYNMCPSWSMHLPNVWNRSPTYR